MTISRVLRALELASTWLASAAVFMTMLIIAAEIVFRFFGSFIPGSVELITYYLIVGIAFLPLGQIERRGEMISMDLFSTLAGRWINSAMDWSNGLISVVVYGVLTAATLEFAIGKAQDGAYVLTSTYALVTWPAYFLLPISCGLGGIMALLRTIAGPPEKERPDPIAPNSFVE
jgi:TRAP-type C4-dicarboxylate transport system permease small subunit